MNHTLHRFLAISALIVLLAVPAVGFAQKEPAAPGPGTTVTDPKGGTAQTLPGQPTTAQAQSDDGFVSLTNIEGLDRAAEAGDFAGLLNNLYLLCVGAGAILAVLQVLRGGLTYMLSDSVTNKKEARDTIVMALVGLLLVLSPTIVFGIIDPRILSLQVNFSGIRPTQPTGTGSPSTAPTTFCAGVASGMDQMEPSSQLNGSVPNGSTWRATDPDVARCDAACSVFTRPGPGSLSCTPEYVPNSNPVERYCDCRPSGISPTQHRFQSANITAAGEQYRVVRSTLIHIANTLEQCQASVTASFIRTGLGNGSIVCEEGPTQACTQIGGLAISDITVNEVECVPSEFDL